MIDNEMYIRCPQTKENPYGMEPIEKLDGNHPIIFTMIAQTSNDEDLNGAAKTGGSATGFNDTNIVQPLFVDIPQYSWQEVDKTNIQYISASSNSDFKIIFEKYFKPLMYDGDKPKSFEEMLIILRNINILSFCNATLNIEILKECFFKELSKNYSPQEVSLLMKQVVSIDVATRIAINSNKKESVNFTTIHLLSKSDDEHIPDNNQLINGKNALKSGVHILNDSEAIIVVDRLKVADNLDHTFNDFFKLGLRSNTIQGQSCSLLVNLIVSDILNSSLNHNTLSDSSLETLSGTFEPQNIAMVNQLLNSKDLTTESLSTSWLSNSLKKAREENQKILKVQAIDTIEELYKDKETNNFFKKYVIFKIRIKTLIDSYTIFVENYKQFKQSKEFNELSKTQQEIFNNLFENVVNKLEILKYISKTLDEKAQEDIDLNKLSSLFEKTKEFENSKQTNFFKEMDTMLSNYKNMITPILNGNFHSLDEQHEHFKQAYEKSFNSLMKTIEQSM